MDEPARRRRWPYVAAVLLVVAGLAAWRFSSGSSAPTVRYDTAVIERGDVISRVTATGTLSATVTVQVGSQVSGRIQDLLVDYNAPVKKGQVIARIDPALFQAAVDEARANVAAAAANLQRAQAQAADAERQLKRTAGLAEKSLVSQADADTATSAADVARATVAASESALAQAKASVRRAELNLSYATIVSPIDGTVIARSVDVGQTVAASLQAPTLFTLAGDLRQMQVDTSVGEADIGKLTPGMDATFTVDAYPNERFKATIRQIRNAPVTLQNVVTYTTIVDVENPEQKLKPGMTANVTFVVASRENTLRVPNAALRFRPAGARGPGAGMRPPRGEKVASVDKAAEKAAERPADVRSDAGPAEAASAPRAPKKTVYVLRQPATEPVAVELRTGVTDGSFTEVVEGDLHEGDVVVTDASDPTKKPAASGFPGMTGGGGRRGP